MGERGEFRQFRGPEFREFRFGNAVCSASSLCYSNRYLQETEMRLKLTQGYLRAAMVKSLKNAGMTHERLLTTMGEVKGRRGRDVDM